MLMKKVELIFLLRVELLTVIEDNGKVCFRSSGDAAEKQGQLMSEGDVAGDNYDAVGGIMAMLACKQVVWHASRRRSWPTMMHEIDRGNSEKRKKEKTKKKQSNNSQ